MTQFFLSKEKDQYDQYIKSYLPMFYFENILPKLGIQSCIHWVIISSFKSSLENLSLRYN